MARGLSILFPREPRRLPGHRAIKILFRATHVPCAGILAGAYLFGAAGALREQWLLATIATGFLILFVDLFESGVFLLQVRGLVLILKLGLLGALPQSEGRAAWILAILLAISVLASHAPGRIRYFVVFGGGRFKGAETKG